MVATMHDVAQCEHNIKNLESIVASNGDDLAAKVEELTNENSKLQEFAQVQLVLYFLLNNINSIHY